MTRCLRRRRERRAETLTEAWEALTNPPRLERKSSDGNESGIRALVELRVKVAEAHRRARCRSLTRALLHDAHVWVDQWLNEWESGDLPAPHMIVLSQQMVIHLQQVAERLSTVADMEARHAGAPDWPATDQGGS